MQQSMSQTVAWRTMLGLAVVCFGLAISVLGFERFSWPFSCLKWNAMFYGCTWAVAPPLWFWIERGIWGTKENEKKMEVLQGHARDIWLGFGAIVLFLADKRFHD